MMAISQYPLQRPRINYVGFCRQVFLEEIYDDEEEDQIEVPSPGKEINCDLQILDEAGEYENGDGEYIIDDEPDDCDSQDYQEDIDELDAEEGEDEFGEEGEEEIITSSSP